MRCQIQRSTRHSALGRLAQHHVHMQTAAGNRSEAHSAVQGPKSLDGKLATFPPTHPLPPSRLMYTAASLLTHPPTRIPLPTHPRSALPAGCVKGLCRLYMCTRQRSDSNLSVLSLGAEQACVCCSSLHTACFLARLSHLATPSGLRGATVAPCFCTHVYHTVSPHDATGFSGPGSGDHVLLPRVRQDCFCVATRRRRLDLCPCVLPGSVLPACHGRKAKKNFRAHKSHPLISHVSRLAAPSLDPAR